MKQNNIEIINYHPQHQRWFEELNRQWIEKYFRLEPVDRFVLSDPEKAILRKGGAILMARLDDGIVGAVGLKKIDAVTFEFTKMAVREDCRGRGIGEALGYSAIDKARTLGAERVVLYSHTSLRPAIQLYRKLGFREISLEQGAYQRCDIKMELWLDPLAIVQADASHASLIAGIGRQSFADAFRPYFDRRQDLDQYLAHTYQDQKIAGSISKPNNVFFLCFEKNQPVGFAKIKRQSPQQKIQAERQTELQKIYVLKEFQGKGVAQALLQSVFDLAVKIRPEYIWLDVLTRNARAIRFYQKNGFTKSDIHFFTIGTQRFEYDVMVKPFRAISEHNENLMITSDYGTH